MQQLAKKQKMQLTEMEMKAYEIEDNSSDVSLHKLAFTHVPVTFKSTTSASLLHANNTSNDHNQGHTHRMSLVPVFMKSGYA